MQLTDFVMKERAKLQEERGQIAGELEHLR